MAFQISISKYCHAGVRSIYNADRFTKEQVAELLADGAAKLLEQKELICETRSARCYSVVIGACTCFAKEYKPRKLHRRVMDSISPVSHLSFRSGIRVLKANLPTPTPLIAAKVIRNGEPVQILLTDYCEKSVALDQKIKGSQAKKRGLVMDEIAHLLADLHGKGFYLRQLRSTNILVSEYENDRAYWLIDLDRLSSHRFMTCSDFVKTVARACGEFYTYLSPEEGKHLLRECFHAALKQNIYKKPSQEPDFVKTATQQIKQRQRS